MKIISYYTCLINLFLCKEILSATSSNSFINGFTNYLQEKSNFYQAMFIIDEDVKYSDDRVNSFVKEVASQFPIISFTSSRIPKYCNVTYLSFLRRPRKTTLFISIYNGDKGNLSVPFENGLYQLRRLSVDSIHPKCLLIPIQDGKYDLQKSDFQYFFGKDWLDIAVLEIPNQDPKSLSNDGDNTTILHQYDPFQNQYSDQKVSSTTQWFSNTLHNLNGFIINLKDRLVGDYTFPPESKLKEKLSDILASTMNFVPNVQLFNEYDEADGSIMDSIKKPELVLERVRDLVVKEESIQMHVSNFESLRAVIPNSVKFKKSLVLSSEFFYMGCVTFGIIVFIRLLVFIMHLEKETWQIFSTLQIIMGMPADRVPKKTLGRIIFGSLIITCIVYTIYFYSAFLDIALQEEPEISSLEELANSNLTLMTDSVTKWVVLLMSPNPYIRKLVENAVEVNSSHYLVECLYYLNTHKNISCLIYDAEFSVNNYMRLTNTQNLKILKEPATLTLYTWLTRPGSPFTDRFSEIILKATETGLLNDYLRLSRKSIKITSSSLLETIKKDKLLFIAFYVLLIGYSLSGIVFITELLMGLKFKKKSISRGRIQRS